MPNPLPTPTEENSWLTFDDPDGVYHLRYPQQLSVYSIEPGSGINLAKGEDMVEIRLIPKSGDPIRDRNEADWTQNKKKIEDGWKDSGQKYLPGPAGELPAADWAPLKRRVFRIEFALLPKDEENVPRSQRFYMDRYLVLFTRNECFRLRPGPPAILMSSFGSEPRP